MRPTLDFLLHDWLQAEELTRRERFAEHTRETFDAVLDTCERIARERFAPFNRLVDTEEPRVEGGRVVLPQAKHEAWRAYADSGMLAAAQDAALGGMQLHGRCRLPEAARDPTDPIAGIGQHHLQQGLQVFALPLHIRPAQPLQPPTGDDAD